MSLSNYPPGLSDHTPGAPWNDYDIPEQEFDVCISQTLSKNTTVWTNDYTPGASGVDYEPDDEGGYCSCGWHDPDDTSDTDFVKAYKDNHYTPLELINACKELAKWAMEESGKKRLNNLWLPDLIKECDDWNADETEVIEEE